jgi:hypothetical protein
MLVMAGPRVPALERKIATAHCQAVGGQIKVSAAQPVLTWI